jgi:hypothetical protein
MIKLLERDIKAVVPDQIWISDIIHTYRKEKDGFI